MESISREQLIIVMLTLLVLALGFFLIGQSERENESDKDLSRNSVTSDLRRVCGTSDTACEEYIEHIRDLLEEYDRRGASEGTLLVLPRTPTTTERATSTVRYPDRQWSSGKGL